MSKNKSGSTGKIVAIIAVVLAVAILATGLLLGFFLKNTFKPTEFEIVTPVTGEGSGYYRYCYNDLNEK